jgi:type IV secretory pathway VirB2 component (pilin)
MSNRSLRVTVALLAGVLWMAAQSGPALAQSTQMQELLNRIERLQQELTTLQGYVYRGATPPAGRVAPR